MEVDVNKNHYEKLLKNLNIESRDIQKRELKNGTENLSVLFIKQLTDAKKLETNVINQVQSYIDNNNGLVANHLEILKMIEFRCDCILDNNEESIIGYILNGMTLLIFSNSKYFIAINLKKVEKRAVLSPELTFTLRGPRDSLNENIDDNLSLIRYRVKDPNLRIEKLMVGRRTNTGVAVLYIKDVANEQILSEIIDRIQKVDVDGVIDSGELQNFLLDKNSGFFPEMGVIERSDMAAGALLEGKVVVLVEGAALAIVAPKLFHEFFTSCEDFYDNRYISILAKSISMISSLISVIITALYVAVIAFHSDALPADFIILISNSQKGVPFSVFVGAIITEFMLEMLREALIRVPKEIGPGIGIVGGIVIGQAAIAANVFSPLLLIITAMSMLSSFTAPDYIIMNSLRISKFFLILLSGIFGLIGFTVGISFIFLKLVSTNSFGIPYFAPFAPFNLNDIKNMIFYGRNITKYRPNYLKPKDNSRSK